MSPSRKLPVDFEKKVKQAPSVDGNGYPYKLSAKDLMENYKYLLDMLPDADAGDMIYCDGTKWVAVKAPAPSSQSTMVLSHTGTEPEWIESPVTGASLYHVINRLLVDMDGNVLIAEPDLYTMCFHNGILIWTWDSTSGEPEPELPPDVGTTFYSVNLTETS